MQDPQEEVEGGKEISSLSPAVTQGARLYAALRKEGGGVAACGKAFALQVPSQPVGKLHTEDAKLLQGCHHQASTPGKQIVRAERECPLDHTGKRKHPSPCPALQLSQLARAPTYKLEKQ